MNLNPDSISVVLERRPSTKESLGCAKLIEHNMYPICDVSVAEKV